MATSDRASQQHSDGQAWPLIARGADQYLPQSIPRSVKPIISFVAVGRPNLDQESIEAGMVTEQQKPTILLVSELRGDLLAGEFGRYVRDYEVQTATSAAEAEHHAKDIRGAGGQVALMVTESVLPDADVLDAFDRWRAVVPTARCLVAAHVEGFLDESRHCGVDWRTERSTPGS